jgi:hypothetical protein
VSTAQEGRAGNAGTSILGVVLTADGQPIEGARVELWAPLGRWSDSLSLAESNVTDSVGCFGVFSFHQPGTVEISVMARGFKTLTTSTPHGLFSMEVVRISANGGPGARSRRSRPFGSFAAVTPFAGANVAPSLANAGSPRGVGRSPLKKQVRRRFEVEAARGHPDGGCLSQVQRNGWR